LFEGILWFGSEPDPFFNRLLEGAETPRPASAAQTTTGAIGPGHPKSPV